MKNIFIALTLVGAMAFVSCDAQNKKSGKAADSSAQEAQASVINKDVNVAEFEKLVAGGKGLLLDVRTDGEYSEGHLNGATQIDFYRSDFQNEIAKLNKDVPVYIYCRSGGRSGQAAQMMKDMGFKEVYNLAGGIGAWQGSGKPVVR
jgi:rhodanese-related sulfurtransferase